MAKLSAHGREEVVRFEINRPLSDGVNCTIVRALMSDNAILEKTKFKRPDGTGWSTGWTKFGRLKSEVTVEQWKENYAKLGWRQVRP